MIDELDKEPRNRPATSVIEEVKITPEMIEAGKQELYSWLVALSPPSAEGVIPEACRAIYREMYLVGPKVDHKG